MMTPLVASLSCAPISANSFFSASVSLNVSIQQPQPQSNSMAYILVKVFEVSLRTTVPNEFDVVPLVNPCVAKAGVKISYYQWFLSPLSAVPLVALSGFGLYELGFPVYIPHVMKGEKPIVYRFAVLFSVTIVWIYAHLLSVGGAYKNVPQTTQDTCRIDRVGIISSAPWYASATPLPPSVLSCGVD